MNCTRCQESDCTICPECDEPMCGYCDCPAEEPECICNSCECETQHDCPVCETDKEDWNAEGCSCWFCPSCKTTNPETNDQCECGHELELFTTCNRCHMMSIPIINGSAPDLCDSCEDNTTECDDCGRLCEWSERRQSWVHPIPSDCFMASIMPTFEYVSHECETPNCGNLITVPHSNMYANCERCDTLQLLEDHTEEKPW